MCGWSRSVRGRAWLMLAAALLSAHAGWIVGCRRESSAPEAPASRTRDVGDRTLRLSQRNEPADLDPAAVTLPDEFAILRALSEGLLVPGPNGGAPAPGVASRFTVSPDGLTYTFHLRPEARWSNGEPLTAADFVASYRRMLTPATAAVKAGVFFPVKNARAFVTGTLADFGSVGIHALDAHTLVITLEEPRPGFPHYVASGPWLPVHLPTIERHGRNWTAPENHVGNGPFTLAEWRPQQRIIVRKNPHWHGAGSVRLAEIHFLRFDSNEAEERAYRAGQIDATMALPVNKLETHQRERRAEVHRAPMIETRYLAFNTRRAPLDDRRVRRALALALDREKLVQRVLQGGQDAAGRFVPPALRANPEARPLSGQHQFDPHIARRLLAAAGVDPKKLRPLELTGWSNPPLLEAIQAMWRQELGLDVRIALREAKVHVDALRAGQFDIGFITAIPDVADAADLLGDFITGAPDNYPGWADATYDHNWQQAVRIADPVERARALLDAEQQLLGHAPVTPLYFNTKIWLMSRRVRGWNEDGLWTRNFATISLDEP